MVVVAEAIHKQRNYEAVVVRCVCLFLQIPMSDPDGNGAEKWKMSQASGLCS